MSPDLEEERKVIVTPVLKWLAGLVIRYGESFLICVWIVAVGIGVGAAAGWYATREVEEAEEVEGDGKEDEGSVGDVES